ncbi:transcriptional regulator [Pseudarthrobacter sp. N5]|uniref:transcriptional regulator n=1 Tax=Pseudarthrobacter sp. N5 TaxID=3418416 RepID=UPI003CF7E2DF
MGLAGKTGLGALVDEHLKLPDYFGANAGLKLTALVAGMVAGADCIDDLGLLRHGAMGKLFKGTYAPSTIGSFLRTFMFGHVHQLDAAAARWLQQVNMVSINKTFVGKRPKTWLEITSHGSEALRTHRHALERLLG